MEPITPIPIPARVIWREVRIRLLPSCIFLGVVVAVLTLWNKVNTSQTTAGFGEGTRALISSPQPGRLERLMVRPYQFVNQGDPVAVVRPIDPRMPLDLLRTELDLARLQMEPSIIEQNALSYERVRVELLRTRSELAVARVNLARAESELKRNKPLYDEKLVSEDIYELSVNVRDALLAEIDEKSRAAAEIEARLNEMRSVWDPTAAPRDPGGATVISRLGTELQGMISNAQSITLVAPISGMVAVVQRQPGENVLDGESLVQIHSLWSERVVAYLRQPYPVEPEIGLPVRVMTRSPKRHQFWTEITHVGAQVEVITNSLAFINQGELVDAGLPIVVSLPPDARIRPGEIVDIWIKSTKPSFTDPPAAQPTATPQAAMIRDPL